jgi:hypothetical protein
LYGAGVDQALRIKLRTQCCSTEKRLSLGFLLCLRVKRKWVNGIIKPTIFGSANNFIYKTFFLLSGPQSKVAD